MEQNTFPAHPAPGSGNIGPLAAAVVVVILLAAAGFYFLYQQQNQEALAQPESSQQTQTATSGGDFDSMEAELDATQTSGAEADVTNLENAL